MRLKQFLQESINTKEFEQVLNNKNLLAGCEFEFYLPENDITNLQGVDKLWELATRETRNMNDKLEKFEQETSKITADNEKLDDMITSLKDQDKVKNKPKMKLLLKKYDENEDKIEQISNKYTFTYKDLPHYFNLAKEIDNIVQWINAESHMAIGTKKKFDQICEEWLLGEGYVPTPDDFYMDNVRVLLTSIDNTHLIDKHLKTLKEWEFPLDFSNVTTNDDDKNPTKWKVVTDISLKTIPSLGLEVVTPTMQISELIDTIEDVFMWMGENKCWTDNTCGFHVHVSLKPDKHNDIDPVKLMLFVEEGLLYKNFADRIGSGMAQALKDGHLDTYKPFTSKSVKDLVVERDLSATNVDKFMGLHFINMVKNHVEFRYMGAKDYHKKFAFVRQNVVNYGHWMSIACDDGYKREEFITKVSRIVNTVNAIHNQMFLDICNENMSEFDKKTQKPQIQALNVVIRNAKKKIVKSVKLDKYLYDKIKRMTHVRRLIKIQVKELFNKEL